MLNENYFKMCEVVPCLHRFHEESLDITFLSYLLLYNMCEGVD